MILKSKAFLLFLFFFCILFALFRFSYQKESSYQLNDTEFLGRIQSFYFEDGYLHLTISSSGEALTGITMQEFPMIDLHLDDFIKVKGTLQELPSATNFYAFDYASYARRHHQYYSIKIENVEVLEVSHSVFYNIKDTFTKKIQTFRSAPYLHAFLLGDTSFITDSVMESYRNNGISHLLAISGMHVSFLMGALQKLFQKIRIPGKFQLLLFFFFLAFYLFLVDFSPSVIRASLFFFLLQCKKIFHWNIDPIFLLGFIFFFLIFINPYYLFEIGFQYSFSISFVLVLFSSRLKNKKYYFSSLIATSYLAFVASIIIGVFHFHSICLFSIFYNLFFVPFVSFLIFPFSFITFLCPFLENIYLFFIQVLEGVSLHFSAFSFASWTMKHPSFPLFLFLLGLTVLVLFLFYKKKRVGIFILFLGLFFYHHVNFFTFENYVIAIDVGQGDSTLLVSSDKTMLIDTGGSIYKDLATRTIIPILKAKGILQLDYLVLTHGDFDHMGGAISLVNNFKVEKVIFNCGSYNDLENKLIRILNKKNIQHYTCIQELNLNNHKLYFLNNKDYGNENDNSSVIYTKFNGYQFLFMGDASTLTEKEILKHYHLSSIDVLKVGHHGSKTSSSKEFINIIKPKYSFISVGKSNRYGHPNKEVLDHLKNSEIYRTDIDGSIMFKIKNNKLKIETCAP